MNLKLYKQILEALGRDDDVAAMFANEVIETIDAFLIENPNQVLPAQAGDSLRDIATKARELEVLLSSPIRNTKGMLHASLLVDCDINPDAFLLQLISDLKTLYGAAQSGSSDSYLQSKKGRPHETERFVFAFNVGRLYRDHFGEMPTAYVNYDLGGMGLFPRCLKIALGAAGMKLTDIKGLASAVVKELKTPTAITKEE